MSDESYPEREQVPAEGAGEEEEDKGLIERLRGTGVGVEDPNIVGDVGPTDVPPGRDPDSVPRPAEPPPA